MILDNIHQRILENLNNAFKYHCPEPLTDVSHKVLQNNKIVNIIYKSENVNVQVYYLPSEPEQRQIQIIDISISSPIVDSKFKYIILNSILNVCLEIGSIKLYKLNIKDKEEIDFLIKKGSQILREDPENGTTLQILNRIYDTNRPSNYVDSFHETLIAGINHFLNSNYNGKVTMSLGTLITDANKSEIIYLDKNGVLFSLIYSSNQLPKKSTLTMTYLRISDNINSFKLNCIILNILVTICKSDNVSLNMIDIKKRGFAKYLIERGVRYVTSKDYKYFFNYENKILGIDLVVNDIIPEEVENKVLNNTHKILLDHLNEFYQKSIDEKLFFKSSSITEDGAFDVVQVIYETRNTFVSLDYVHPKNSSSIQEYIRITDIKVQQPLERKGIALDIINSIFSFSRMYSNEKIPVILYKTPKLSKWYDCLILKGASIENSASSELVDLRMGNKILKKNSIAFLDQINKSIVEGVHSVLHNDYPNEKIYIDSHVISKQRAMISFMSNDLDGNTLKVTIHYVRDLRGSNHQIHLNYIYLSGIYKNQKISRKIIDEIFLICQTPKDFKLNFLLMEVTNESFGDYVLSKGAVLVATASSAKGSTFHVKTLLDPSYKSLIKSHNEGGLSENKDLFKGEFDKRFINFMHPILSKRVSDKQVKFQSKKTSNTSYEISFIANNFLSAFICELSSSNKKGSIQCVLFEISGDNKNKNLSKVLIIASQQLAREEGLDLYIFNTKNNHTWTEYLVKKGGLLLQKADPSKNQIAVIQIDPRKKLF